MFGIDFKLCRQSSVAGVGPHIDAIKEALHAAKTPFLATGNIPLDEHAGFSLLVPNGNNAYTGIQFPLESDTALSPLIAACKEATFGRGNTDVLDPSYRSALVLHANKLSIMPWSAIDPHASGILASIKRTLFNEDQLERKTIVACLDKLNVYKQGDFFKNHVDTPKSKDMFGTLVVNLPSDYVGGQLVIRAQELSDGKDARREHSCDWGKDRDIGWVAFFSDCEHEVLPVTSGYRFVFAEAMDSLILMHFILTFNVVSPFHTLYRLLAMAPMMNHIPSKRWVEPKPYGRNPL